MRAAAPGAAAIFPNARRLRLASAFSACLLIAGGALAEPVQVWRDPSGAAHYSDRPPPRPSPPPAACPADYRLRITAPENDGARISPAGRLRIRYRLQPRLCSGHRLQLLADDRVLEIPRPSGEFLLQNLHPGERRLRLRILGADGEPLTRSALRRVYLL